eukprot:CAMPEP_0180187458 /NCGR_PEP_ID=MMETSP0986-20121125/43549_1 /TAXON_ID=697907 /ORGANISM="non described non described, Strain CCMP2293" /LENGTH=43 /DNA_ID= /DNA_START= /DNA_END= /DNA_ORIENTATION=
MTVGATGAGGALGALTDADHRSNGSGAALIASSLASRPCEPLS